MGKIASRFALFSVVMLSACALSSGAEGPSTDVARRRALEYGIVALEDGDYRLAAERLAPVAAICPVDGPGRQAMLLLAAAELDPRNADGRPDVAAELAAFQLARRAEGDVEGAVAAQLYTLALDYGATPIAADEIPGAGLLWTRYLSDPEIMDSALGVPATDSAAATPAALAEAGRAEAQTQRAVAAADGGPTCDVPGVDDDLVMPELTREPLALRSARPAPQQPSGAQAPAGGGDTRALQAEIERLQAELTRKEQELDRIRRTLRP